MKKRICCLLLACLLLVPLSSACKRAPKEVTVDSSFVIVCDKTDGYAFTAANLLCGALRSLLGERLEVLSDEQFDPESAEGHAIFVGKSAHLGEVPAPGANRFSISMTKDGIVIVGEDALALYLGVCVIAERWGVEAGYGAVTDAGLTLDRKSCESFNAIDIKRDEMLSVMSQNVRCADDGGKNDIDDRKVRLQQLVEDYSPDLLGTQEATKRWMGIFEEYFSDAYGIFGCSRDGEYATSGEWNAILYKKERFEFVRGDTFWLSETPDEVSVVENALCNRICTWAILRDKYTDREILFCNTHLDHSNDTVRDAQAKVLMQFINEHVGQYPIFLTGDFNTGYGKQPYLTVTGSMVDSRKQADVDVSTVKGTFHNYGRANNEIDFCFYAPLKATPVAYRVLSDDYDGFVSDHYGVIAYFQYK